MNSAIVRAKPHIPLDSGELLWEWHPQSDAFFLSRGAQVALGLTGSPGSMSRFTSHIPPAYRTELDTLRAGALSGNTGSRAEYSYLFNAAYVHESLMVLERNDAGVATVVLGNLEILTASTPYLDSVASGEDFLPQDSGIWACNFTERTLLLDARCRSFLNLPKNQRSMGVDEWLALLHQDDWERTFASTRLVFENEHMGDSFEYMMRMRRVGGGFTHLLVRGVVLDRNEEGGALLAAGIVEDAERPDLGQTVREKENTRLLTAVKAAGDGMWDWDPINNTVYYSPRYIDMLGYKPEDFSPSLEPWAVRVHPDDYESTVQKQLDIIASPRYGDTFECTYRFRWADGIYRWILGRGHVTHRDESGRATRVMGMHTDITKLQRDREKLEGMIRNDTLTLVRSRDYGTMELERLDKNSIRPVSIIYGDVNGLKMLNDHLGHHAGDRLLAMAGSLLRSSLRASECIARMGGDEFMVILPYCERDKAADILKHIEESFARYNATPNTMPVLLAFGLACGTNPAISIFQTVREADADMLRRKLANRPESHAAIRAWLSRQEGAVVPLQDPRCESSEL